MVSVFRQRFVVQERPINVVRTFGLRFSRTLLIYARSTTFCRSPNVATTLQHNVRGTFAQRIWKVNLLEYNYVIFTFRERCQFTFPQRNFVDSHERSDNYVITHRQDKHSHVVYET